MDYYHTVNDQRKCIILFVFKTIRLMSPPSSREYFCYFPFYLIFTLVVPCNLSNWSGVPEDITHVHIRKGVKEIPANAFSHWRSLLSIQIPSTVKSIGNGAFERCESLTKIHLPNSIEFIGDEAFQNCISLLSIRLPSTIKSIGMHTFGSCESLSTIHLPDNIEFIGHSAFSHCKSLQSFAVPSRLRSIGCKLFCHCKSLKSITFNEHITEIGFCAFQGCSSLTSVIIPPNVTTIRHHTFQECSSLSSISFHPNVKRICGHPFERCKKLKEIIIPSHTEFDPSSTATIYHRHDLRIIRSNWWLLYECVKMRELIDSGRASVIQQENEVRSSDRDNSFVQQCIARQCIAGSVGVLDGKRELGNVYELIVNTCDVIFRTVMEMAKEKSIVDLPEEESDSMYSDSAYSDY